MDNKEYLEEIKKDENLNSYQKVGNSHIEYRKMKAFEIIAEELIDTRDFLTGLSTLYKDLMIDVEKLKEGK